MIYLSLSGNSITSLPQFTTNKLQYLYLQINGLQGSFPTWICNMKHLNDLDLSNNSISGVVPQCLGNMSSSLESLNINANMIQGSFPTIICNMSSLLYLDMSDNNFHGVIPQCFGNITSSLKLINLGRNNFYGTTPKMYGNCDLSIGLILQGNMLEGEVPRSLANCQSMKILDLGNNRLNGTFPRWLGYFQKLQVLILRSNNLHGTIETPSAMEFLFPSLSVFDISSNGFVGRLPEKYFECFNAIKDVDKEPKTKFVSISGLPSYSINFLGKESYLNFFDSTSISILFTFIDLSSNKFEEEIPNVIGNPGLCGPPLETNCEDLKSLPKVESKGGEWIYVESVMSGLGFGTLLGEGFGQNG
ncbi:hypothetical protein R6Q59_022670 [Mikania micrantha]